MTPSITAVGFSLTPANSELINSKLARIAYAEDLIVDLIIKVKYDVDFSAEATVNFKWGAQAHVAEKDKDFGAAINIMMDVLDNKIKKEKDKHQQK